MARPRYPSNQLGVDLDWDSLAGSQTTTRKAAIVHNATAAQSWNSVIAMACRLNFGRRYSPRFKRSLRSPDALRGSWLTTHWLESGESAQSMHCLLEYSSRPCRHERVAPEPVDGESPIVALIAR